jgi:hypothetical protein
MIIPRKEELRDLSGVPNGSLKDTKRAVVFATLGLPLDPRIGILVMRKAGQDRLDSEAHYTFNITKENFDRVNAVYEAQKADVELDELLERLKAHPPYAAIGTELERVISDALIIYGRRFLENYQRMVKLLTTNGRDIEIIEKPAGAFQFKFMVPKRQ